MVQGKVTISNDGATIMKLLDIVHPAAKVLADISLSQDSEVRDPSPFGLAYICVCQRAICASSGPVRAAFALVMLNSNTAITKCALGLLAADAQWRTVRSLRLCVLGHV